MTAHELARKLLEGPDLPVIINGWGSDEGTAHEVDAVSAPCSEIYFSSQDSEMTQKDKLGYPMRRHCISLEHK